MKFALRLVLALALGALTGACVTNGCPPPAISALPVNVEVPLPVPCAKLAGIAGEPAHVASKLTGKAKHDLELVDQSALELRTWGEGLHAQLKACATP